MSPAPRIPLSRHLLFWPVAAIGCGADLWSKHWMFSQPDLLRGQVPRWVWQNHAGFQLSLNEGALFGLGQGGVWLFATCSIFAAIAIPTWLFVFGGARDAVLTAVLGAILGGVLGNLYDRMGMPGLDWGDFQPGRAGEHIYAVRDFILLTWKWPPQARWHVWPNFNIADSLLVCGAIAILVLSFRRTAPQESTTPARAVKQPKS